MKGSNLIERFVTGCDPPPPTLGVRGGTLAVLGPGLLKTGRGTRGVCGSGRKDGLADFSDGIFCRMDRGAHTNSTRERVVETVISGRVPLKSKLRLKRRHSPEEERRRNGSNKASIISS